VETLRRRVYVRVEDIMQSALRVILVLPLFAGCAATSMRPAAEPELLAQRTQAEAPPARGHAAHYAVPCPTDLAGTSVMVTPLEDGAALLFVAPRGPKVEELRRRVRGLARTQNRGAIIPPGDPEPSAIEAAQEADEPREPTATVDDIESGARLKFTPSRLDQLTDVQANVVEYAQRLAGGKCPLVRDELSLMPSRALSGGSSPIMPVPAGIIPGVGGLPTPTVMPGVGMF
jgi:hypothetical protein